MAYFAKRAGDLDMVAIPNKAGASGVINDMLTGSTQVAFLNVGEHRAAGEGRQPAAARRRQSCAARRIFPICRPCRSSAIPASAPSPGRALFAPAGTPKDVLQTIFDATVAAMKTPEVVDAFQKQTFNIVPNASLADAKTWLAQQMDTWRKITSEVKIETE